MTRSQEHLTPFAHAAHNRCFGCGPANPSGMQLKFMLAPDGSVVSLPVIADAFDGHPGFLHGGIIATLLDEAMSKAVRATGRLSMTRKMEVEYLRPVPSGVPLRIEGRVVRNERRKHWVESRILDADGEVLAECNGLFIEISERSQKSGRSQDQLEPNDRPALHK